MKIPRDLATPLTIGAFAIMAGTGILMFFHADTGLNKTVHEWAGWALVAGVALHVAVNWGAFRRYFTSSRLGQGVMGLGVLVLAASFVPFGGQGGGFPPPVIAMKAITSAPIATIAPLTGHTIDEVLADLANAGIALPGPDATIASLAAGDRGVEGRAIRALFAND